MNTDSGKPKRGRPIGTPGGGKYNCTTKVVRVPERVADNIKEILDSFEAIKALVDDWELRVQDAAHKSAKGEPSVRYERAMQLLEELRRLL